jgi:hypothetical protein
MGKTKSLEDVLRSLRVKPGLMCTGTHPIEGPVGSWKVAFGYDRQPPGAFTLTLYFGEKSKTISLPKDDVETRGRSDWMTDNTWRLTEQAVAKHAAGIRSSQEATAARIAREQSAKQFNVVAFNVVATNELLLSDAKRGDVVKIGPTKWIIFRPQGTFIAWAYKHPSSHRKLYEIAASGRGSDLYEVWQTGGSAQRLKDKPEIVGQAEIIGNEIEALS